MHIDVPSVETQKLVDDDRRGNNKRESSEEIQKRVQKARDVQTRRYKNTNSPARARIKANSEMTTKSVKEFCQLSVGCRTMMVSATNAMNLTARSYFKVIKIARTIADLAGEDNITTSHLAEALQYRPKEEDVI